MSKKNSATFTNLKPGDRVKLIDGIYEWLESLKVSRSGTVQKVGYKFIHVKLDGSDELYRFQPQNLIKTKASIKEANKEQSTEWFSVRKINKGPLPELLLTEAPNENKNNVKIEETQVDSTELERIKIKQIRIRNIATNLLSEIYTMPVSERKKCLNDIIELTKED